MSDPVTREPAPPADSGETEPTCPHCGCPVQSYYATLASGLRVCHTDAWSCYRGITVYGEPVGSRANPVSDTTAAGSGQHSEPVWTITRQQLIDAIDGIAARVVPADRWADAILAHVSGEVLVGRTMLPDGRMAGVYGRARDAAGGDQ